MRHVCLSNLELHWIFIDFSCCLISILKSSCNVFIDVSMETRGAFRRDVSSLLCRILVPTERSSFIPNTFEEIFSRSLNSLTGNRDHIVHIVWNILRRVSESLTS